MSPLRQKWIRSLQSSSIVMPPPQNLDQRRKEILAYVELFAQFASESFGDDVSELVRNHYPHCQASLLDDVLAMFILHHPEYGHAILHALLSCILDGTIVYDKKAPPFGAFISLFSPSSEHLQKDVSEQWALACGEILRVLTHYNRPISKRESNNLVPVSAAASSSYALRTHHDVERKTLMRLLTPWITDSLLAAPLGVKSDYFRWCGGVMGKYAAGGELKPPMTVGSKGPGKHPQLMPSTPRWAVANGAAVILSVCDDEVSRYETAELTAAAVPALLLPPPATALDEHLVAGLPPLEPFARLFHRYYAIATPGATQRLFLGLLEAPPSWAPDALDAAVQLIELLRAAEDYSSTMQLPRNWLHLHFLRPVGAAMAMRSGIAADAAAALLFRVFSQPALLFPPPGHAQEHQERHSLSRQLGKSTREQMVHAAAKATEEATARGIASLMCDHGPDVEWQLCTIWEAAYGLLPLNSAAASLPELVVATPLQPPALSWNLFRPLLRVLEYLPHGSPSEACLLRIFTATVEVILRRAVPNGECEDQSGSTGAQFGSGKFVSRQVASTELRAMVHSLFTEAYTSATLAARLLSLAFTVCFSHDALQPNHRKGSRLLQIDGSATDIGSSPRARLRISGSSTGKERGVVATFDSYVVAAVCALACEMQLLSLPAPILGTSKSRPFLAIGPEVDNVEILSALQCSVGSAVRNARRLLRILEALLSLVPRPSSQVPTDSATSSSGEIVAAAVVAAHVSEALGKSKACVHALTAISRCLWEPKLSGKAASVLALVEGNRKVVAAVVDTSRRPLLCEGMNAQEMQECAGRRGCHDEEAGPLTSPVMESEGEIRSTSSKEGFLSSPVNASDMVSLLCMDKDKASSDSIGLFVTTVLRENKDLSIAAVPLLCKKLLSAPEVPTGGEGTSAKRGWRQVVEALCNIVSVYPENAASAIMIQIEKDLQPWACNNDAQEIVHVWKANTRIVCLLMELLRLHHACGALEVVAKYSTTLELATEGLSVDGEACTMPQLELLEAVALATQLLIPMRSSTALSLCVLLKMRLPAVVHCLSHTSAHVRALSVALLQDEAYSSSANLPRTTSHVEEGDWKALVRQCVVREFKALQELGMPTSSLVDAALSLGCPL